MPLWQQCRQHVTLSGAAASGIGRFAHKDRDPILRAGYERLGARLVSGRFVKHGVPFERAVDNTPGEQFAPVA